MATHKRSHQKIDSRHGIFAGIANYSPTQEGLLSNSKADNTLIATIQRNESKKTFAWTYGGHPDQSKVRKIRLKNGKVITKAIENNIENVIKDFDSDRVVSAILKSGEILEADDLEHLGGYAQVRNRESEKVSDIRKRFEL